MSEKVSLDYSESKNSQQSDETSSDNYYCDVDNDGVEYSDEKDSFINTTHSDVAIQQIEHVITEEKTFLRFSNDAASTERPTKISIGRHCCTILTLWLGLGLVAWGLVTIVIPLYDFVLVQRLRMQPGLPPFEQWEIPKPEVRLSVYIFSVANPDTFLNGTDEKLRLIEIGPIVYREYLHHKNVVFHENSTLTYTAERRIEFLEDQNEPGILNRTIQVPNFVLLASAASINDKFFEKMGFNFMLKMSGDPMFLNMTIYDYMWYYKSDLIHRVQEFAPAFVPTNNSGVLFQIYEDFNDTYNVRIGPDYGFDNFFEITTVNGAPTVPRFDTSRGDCNASIVGATEGALYKNKLTENSVLWYWRKPLCRQVPLYFEKKVRKDPFDAYRFVLRENVFDRMENEDDDCYKGFFQILPDGFSDVSKCFFDMPFAASNPHFFGRYPNPLTKKLEGFKPDREKHQSFIIVEPVMGVPIDQSARSQSNVIIPELYGFSDEIERFSNMALPTFWVEYRQFNVTTQIENLMYFTLFVLPILQHVITALLLILGVTCLTIFVQRCLVPNTSADEKCARRNSSKFATNCKLHETEIAWNINSLK